MEQADLALTADDEKNLSEIYALLSSSAVAQASSTNAADRFDAVAHISLVQKWPEDKRFPRKLAGMEQVPEADLKYWTLPVHSQLPHQDSHQHARPTSSSHSATGPLPGRRQNPARSTPFLR